MQSKETIVDDLETIQDELEPLFGFVDLKNAKVLDLGCGTGALSTRIKSESAAASVIGVECDEQQLKLAISNSENSDITIEFGEAQSLKYPDASFDVVTMFKSLHHVPVEKMEKAMKEIARVLSNNGVLFVLEPVYAGEFNDLVKLFNDEGYVRKKALEAIDDSLKNNIFKLIKKQTFKVRLSFASFSEFESKIMRATFNDSTIDKKLYTQIKEKFATYLKEDGAQFVRAVHIFILEKA